MKRKIVIRVSMPCEKDRSKAMKIASAFCGVSSVSIGKDNNSVEVVGENIDSVCLAKCLRKKFCVADIISVEEVKPPKPKDPSPPKCDKTCPPPRPKPCTSSCCQPPPCPKPCSLPCCTPLPPCHPPPHRFCDMDSEVNCSVM